MPRGDKATYTDKQERKADHIEKSYESRGVSEKEAERRAWATVNKDDGGGNALGGRPLGLGEEGGGDAQAQRRARRAKLKNDRPRAL
ncbi:MAG TPA: hypothetical protein VII63_10990 [Caulobacteraceae bacterium]